MVKEVETMQANQMETKIMSQVTLGHYLLDRLSQEGVTEIFGVPGDYNFSLLDTIEKFENIWFVNGRNELNAGYAADAYARLKGLSALITTFGVGEMSACNAVAGANSENVPIVHIVGTPPSMAQQEHKLMHHTLMDGNYDVFRKVYEPLSAYTAVLTPENAVFEISKALHIAKEKRKPVYLMVAIDLVTKPIVLPQQQITLPSTKTNQTTLQAALDHAKQLLKQAQKTVLLVDVKTIRFTLEQPVIQLAEAMNIPVASTLYGKGGFDESHPQFIGVYGGAFGRQTVRTTVENADCIIAVGLVWADSNTANFTAKLNPSQLIQIQPNKVKIGAAEYPQVLAEDMLQALQSIGYQEQGTVIKGAFPYDQVIGEPEQALTAASYYPRLQQFLKTGDIVIAETGTFYYGMTQVKLPQSATFIAQGGWQSIGYATPSTYGACIAAPNRRVLLFTGDGALQLTVQEISSMLIHGLRPIIFVLNNHGYTIEKYLNVKTENQNYNQVPNWSYAKLMEVFGGEAFSTTVQNNGELDAALTRVETESQNKLCLIEMIVQDPMDAPQYMLNMRNYLEKQEKQRS
ncbi:indolepyruvate decarboxylase [Pullulanibacillus pueri]|uniref:Alpha-keto-acid decarboxylase n=1 Tax=Pullulanibacillus pueri TaxID=1437324 RepID=A0A8J2ZXA2_9BACL|nr:thiamine pyrophosphate-binding protein [Pullulanibacillus pueri]MBM7683596.1 indolepyruvate decarboxylase [Pullulanibacillus pueri]GGH84542.1 indolepyruvate decarboxylase [Pullulanibacillus pueri]